LTALLLLLATPLFSVYPQEDGNKDNDCPEEGLSSEGMSKHEAGNHNTEDLAACHDNCKDNRSKCLDTVENEELTSH